MQALVIDHSVPGSLAPADVPEPTPAPDEALIAVRAVSVNPGELAHRIPTGEDGSVPGWEAAGVVVRPAADGSGPRAGEAVISFGDGGAWAARRAVSTRTLGVVPEGLDLVPASTLPIAAGSALRAIRTLGPVLGHRLMVTGATGAVGRFAVQLAARAGAEVVAVARDAARHDELTALGAAEVRAFPDEDLAPVHGVVETVGGDHLVAAFRRLDEGATLVSVGRSSGAPATFPAEDLIADHGRSGIRLRTFFLGERLDGLAADFSWLGRELAADRLATDVAETVGFEDLVARLAEPVRGKLVARLDD